MEIPNEKQRLALLDRHRYVAYGGARGGGKSWFVRWKAVLLCAGYPGIKILITRRTYPELLNNHIQPLHGILGGWAKYNKTEKCFYFPNGSTIRFGYCNGEKDLDQYQGAEYDVPGSSPGSGSKETSFGAFLSLPRPSFFYFCKILSK